MAENDLLLTCRPDRPPPYEMVDLKYIRRERGRSSLHLDSFYVLPRTSRSGLAWTRDLDYGLLGGAESDRYGG